MQSPHFCLWQGRVKWSKSDVVQSDISPWWPHCYVRISRQKKQKKSREAQSHSFSWGLQVEQGHESDSGGRESSAGLATSRGDANRSSRLSGLNHSKRGQPGSSKPPQGGRMGCSVLPKASADSSTVAPLLGGIYDVLVPLLPNCILPSHMLTLKPIPLYPLNCPKSTNGLLSRQSDDLPKDLWALTSIFETVLSFNMLSTFGTSQLGFFSA